MLLSSGFYFVLYYTLLFLLIICLNRPPTMKKKYKIIIVLLIGIISYSAISFLANYQLNSITSDSRPHGSQTDLPELTRNNYLMGFLNENRSSYRVSFYDINIDFNIDNKSINGYVTIKAESLNDLNFYKTMEPITIIISTSSKISTEALKIR